MKWKKPRIKTQTSLILFKRGKWKVSLQIIGESIFDVFIPVSEEMTIVYRSGFFKKQLFSLSLWNARHACVPITTATNAMGISFSISHLLNNNNLRRKAITKRMQQAVSLPKNTRVCMTGQEEWPNCNIAKD